MVFRGLGTRAVALALVSAGSLVGVALAAPVSGKVELSGEAPSSEEDDAYYWKAWNGFIDPSPVRLDPAREVTVVLTGTPGDGPAPGCRATLTGGDLMPRTMVVRTGTPVRIENTDGCRHELFSPEITEFAPLATAPGNARAVPIPAGGPYPVQDRLYAHVSGTIVPIDDLVACGTVGPDGAFRFEGVDAGEYTLKVFRDGEVVHEAPLSVADGPVEIEEAIALGGN